MHDPRGGGAEPERVAREDVVVARDRGIGRLEKQLIGAKAQLGTDWEYLPEYTRIAQELVALKAEMDAPTQGTATSTEAGGEGSDEEDSVQTSTVLTLPDAATHDDETDPPPSANVLASQVQVREAIEAVWEMHRERYALAGSTFDEETETAAHEASDETNLPSLLGVLEVPDGCVQGSTLPEYADAKTELNDAQESSEVSPLIEMSVVLSVVPPALLSPTRGKHRKPKQPVGQLMLW